MSQPIRTAAPSDTTMQPDARQASALTDDALTDRVRVWQRRGGHRYSIDDVATAWLAIRLAPAAQHALDLGCGIGSVLLMLVDRLPQLQGVGLEAQRVSFELAEQNLARNGLGSRARVELGDLRDADALARLRAAVPGGFDLVTGTPPYKPAGTATVSPDPQRAYARVELRGGVEAYLAAAARVLGPHGRFVMCAQAEQAARVHAAARASGLCSERRLDVVPLRGRKAQLFSVHCFVPSSAADGCESSLQAGAACAECRGRAAPGCSVCERDALLPGPGEVREIALRDERGARTRQACALREFFGLAAPSGEAPSPRLRPGPVRAPGEPA